MATPLARRLAGMAALLASLSVSDAAEWIYVVQPGDNPWSITERYLDGVRYWPRLQRHNDIRDPTHIAPGTRLRIPVEWLRREPEPVQVEAVSGEVSVQRANQSPRPLELDAALVSGDVLRTAPDGSVELRFADGSRIYLRGGSELRIERSERIPQTDEVRTRLHLPRGRSESGVRSMRKGAGRFEIDTPAAVTSVRGTRFRVSAEAARAWTEVLEGGVRVANDSGRVEVEPGMGTTAVAGRAPAPPVPLLSPPDLSSVPEAFERVPFEFSIPPLPGAVRYRLQIATGPEFATLLDDSVFQSPRLRGPALADGDYYLRVRGIDTRQLGGLDATRRISINARPEPPFLSEPSPEAQLTDGAPTFRWTHATEPGTQYRFQLSDDAAFARLREDIGGIDAAELSLSEALPPALYFWRVAAIDPGEGQGPFSDPQSLRVLPPGPAVAAPSVSDDEILFRWRATGPGASYEFQLARDENFADVMVAERVPDAEIKLPRPEAGTYYVRARTLYPDGIASAYASAQRVEIPDKPNYWALVMIPVIVILLVL
jgi:hypothetical protein